MTPRPPTRTPARRARSLVLHLASGTLAGALLTSILLLAVEVTGAIAARPGTPLPELLATALARLDPGAVPAMAAFGGAAGLASWAVAAGWPRR